MGEEKLRDIVRRAPIAHQCVARVAALSPRHWRAACGRARVRTCARSPGAFRPVRDELRLARERTRASRDRQSERSRPWRDRPSLQPFGDKQHESDRIAAAGNRRRQNGRRPQSRASAARERSLQRFDVSGTCCRGARCGRASRSRGSRRGYFAGSAASAAQPSFIWPSSNNERPSLSILSGRARRFGIFLQQLGEVARRPRRNPSWRKRRCLRSNTARPKRGHRRDARRQSCGTRDWPRWYCARDSKLIAAIELTLRIGGRRSGAAADRCGLSAAAWSAGI